MNGLAVMLYARPGMVPGESRQTDQTTGEESRRLSRLSGSSTNGSFGAGLDC